MFPIKLNQRITLKIHALGSSGEGVGYYEGLTVFVPGALPGEVVEAKITECQKRYGKGKLIQITTPSPDREKPVCPLFGRCGGCQLMHLSYPKQLEMKQQRVAEALKRIGKIEECEVLPCIPSPNPLGYRNKIQLPVREGKEGIEIGLYAQASHDLVPVETCYIHSPIGDNVYKQVKRIIEASPIAPYNPVTGHGELKHLLIKSALNTEEVLVVLVTNQNITQVLQQIAQEIIEIPFVKGVVHNFQPQGDNVILGRDYRVIAGEGYLTEKLLGLKFKVSPASFFQVNPAQAERLYSTALDFAALNGDETVLDAYCGVGTLALIFAKQAKRVIGVECVDEAIQNAIQNASLNGFDNVEFVTANAEDYISRLTHVDVALLNPPRKGCDPSFLSGLKRLMPKKLIYVSCDPATLARDLSQLSAMGYRVEKVQPFDMFPQTAHVETVCSLAKPSA